MDAKRREELIKALKEEGVELQRAEDGIVVKCFIHDEAIGIFLHAIQTTERMLKYEKTNH